MKLAAQQKAVACLVAISMVGYVCCGLAAAQDYPSKPVKIILSNSAGGSPDIVARMVADRLSQSLGHQFFVENRPGGEAMIGAEVAARTTPDGYSLYLGSEDVMVANRFRLKSLSLDPDAAFVPIANIVDSAPFVVAVNPDVPARSFKELISFAKSHPGRLSYGSTIGISDILGRWINKTAGIALQPVPYRENAQAVQNLLAGQIQVLLISWPSVEEFVKAGKLRVLAVSSTKRLASLPTPTIAETYPGLIIEGWMALYGPTGIPPFVVQRLNPAVDKALKDPQVAERIRAYGFTTSGAMSPEWVKANMRTDIERWRGIARDIGLQPQ
jgi:tripartite-type tricarboxylate transporter receptor subunit TctC